GGHRPFESLRFIDHLGAAQQVVERNAAVFENERRRIAGADSHLVLELGDAQTGSARLDDERLDSGAPRGRIDRGPDHAQALGIDSDLCPLVTKIFSPLRTQWSPSRTAVVRMAAVSEPQCGSVMAMLAHFGLPSR